jgi:hypothetical protein
VSDRLPPGWKRIATDLRRTTSLVLSLRWEPLEQYVVVQLGGTVCGGFGPVWSDDAEESLARLAELLREFCLDEVVWGGWPICPRHRTHPLEARVCEGRATWVCPLTGATVATIGELAAPTH